MKEAEQLELMARELRTRYPKSIREAGSGRPTPSWGRFFDIAPKGSRLHQDDPTFDGDHLTCLISCANEHRTRRRTPVI